MIKIYSIQDLSNGKLYIGQTCKTVEQRWKQHQYDSKRLDTYFYRALRDHGFDSFVIKQIDYTENEQEANELETLYIGIFQSHRPDKGYNTTLGGVGCRPTEETVQKMRDNAPWKGKKRGPEFGENLSQKLKGVPKSEEHRRNIGLAHKGKKVSEEELQRLRTLRLGVPFTDEQKKKLSRPGKLNPFFGCRHTDEAKAKISAANTGRVHAFRPRSEEQKQKISETLQGRFAGDKNPNFGKKHSEQTKAKMKAYWAARRIAQSQPSL